MRVSHSRRVSLADEQVSRTIDLSMGRIDVLIEQGEQDARQAMA